VKVEEGLRMVVLENPVCEGRKGGEGKGSEDEGGLTNRDGKKEEEAKWREKGGFIIRPELSGPSMVSQLWGQQHAWLIITCV